MNEGMAALCFSGEAEAEEFDKAVQNCITKTARSLISEQGNVMARTRGQAEEISYPSIAKSGVHAGKLPTPAPAPKKTSLPSDKKDKKKKKGFFS